MNESNERINQRMNELIEKKNERSIQPDTRNRKTRLSAMCATPLTRMTTDDER